MELQMQNPSEQIRILQQVAEGTMDVSQAAPQIFALHKANSTPHVDRTPAQINAEIASGDSDQSIAPNTLEEMECYGFLLGEQYPVLRSAVSELSRANE